MKKLLIIIIAIVLIYMDIIALAQSSYKEGGETSGGKSKYYEMCESTCQKANNNYEKGIEDCIKKICGDDLNNIPKEEGDTSNSIDKLKEENKQLKAQIETLKEENKKNRINKNQQEKNIALQKTKAKQKKIATKKEIKAKKQVKEETNYRESCYQLNYRYGRCGTMAMKGYKCDPADDIVVPVECRNTPESDRGLRDGVKSVY
jgi:regulator of replication initiation timing